MSKRIVSNDNLHAHYAVHPGCTLLQTSRRHWWKNRMAGAATWFFESPVMRRFSCTKWQVYWMLGNAQVHLYFGATSTQGPTHQLISVLIAGAFVVGAMLFQARVCEIRAQNLAHRLLNESYLDEYGVWHPRTGHHEL